MPRHDVFGRALRSLRGEHCKDGRCLRQCGLGLVACGATCSDLQKDDANCGACGKACDTTKEECRAGACVVACKKVLTQPLPDPWGGTWDGLERGPATFADAKATCEALNGRLPIPSELYRVSATKTGAVGQSVHVNPLWSLAPCSPKKQVAVRLSDAGTSTPANDTTQFYRCTCPPEESKSFSGKACFGPAGKDGCFPLPSDGKRYAIDLEDRVPLGKAAATWECAFEHARLATPLQYYEAIASGITPGSDAWLHTADDLTLDYGVTLHWSDPSKFDFESGTYVSWTLLDTRHPFRCAGPTFDGGTHPITIAGEFVGRGTRFKADGADQMPDLGWAPSSDRCFARGGHVPSRAELVTLVGEGLPNGSARQQWTSDQMGYWNTTSGYTAGTVSWMGAPAASTYQHPDDVSWADKSDTHASRCIYYAVDKMYAGPGSACTGGCFEVALPGMSGARMWLDSSDRDAQTFTLAAKACIDAGGHVASERDLTEAIRNGLPNGTNTSLWTSDLQGDEPPALAVFVSQIQWTNVDQAFTDQWNGTDQRRSGAANQRAYRCMWTNELR